MPNFGSNFVNWEQYLAAQGAQPQAQADAMYGALDAQGQGATDAIAGAEAERLRGQDLTFSDATRGQVNRATDEIGAASKGTYGLQALYQNQRKGTGYTPGQGLYDGALTGAAGGSKFQGLRGKYRDLFGGMEAAQGRAGERQAAEVLSDTPVEGKERSDTVGGVNTDKERAQLLARRQAAQAQFRTMGQERNKRVDPVRHETEADHQWFERWGR